MNRAVSSDQTPPVTDKRRETEREKRSDEQLQHAAPLFDRRRAFGFGTAYAGFGGIGGTANFALAAATGARGGAAWPRLPLSSLARASHHRAAARMLADCNGSAGAAGAGFAAGAFSATATFAAGAFAGAGFGSRWFFRRWFGGGWFCFRRSTCGCCFFARAAAIISATLIASASAGRFRGGSGFWFCGGPASPPAFPPVFPLLARLPLQEPLPPLGVSATGSRRQGSAPPDFRSASAFRAAASISATDSLFFSSAIEPIPRSPCEDHSSVQRRQLDVGAL